VVLGDGPVGPEHPAPEAGRDPGRDQPAEQRDQRRDRRSGVVRADQRAHPDRGDRTRRGHAGADGDRERVGLHQVGPRNQVRQADRQPGPDEPAQPGDQQRPQVEGDAVGPEVHGRRDPDGQQHPHQAGHDQHPLAVPAVQQCAGERPDHRVRQQQHRQPRRHGHRIGLPLGVEQHRPAQRGLEHAVGELRREPHAEQPAEAGQAQQPRRTDPLGVDHLVIGDAPAGTAGGQLR
jgi:hypothetical protein